MPLYERQAQRPGAITYPAQVSAAPGEIGFENHSSQISQELLSQFKVSSLLDACCGLAEDVVEFAVKRNAEYTGIDKGTTRVGTGVKKIADVLLSAICQNRWREAYAFDASVLDIPSGIQPKSVAHMRYALCCIKEADRPKAIRQLIDRAVRAVVLIEYDWQPFAGVGKCAHHVNLLRDNMFALMKRMGVDPFAGAALERLLADIPHDCQVSHKRYAWGEISNPACLLDLAQQQYRLANERNLHELAAAFTALESLYQTFVNMRQPLPFTPPVVHTAVIRQPVEIQQRPVRDPRVVFGMR